MKISKLINVAYIVLVGILLGATMALGVVVAPVLFNSTLYLGDELLSHYQQGLLMSAIFVKYNLLLNVTVLAVVLKEAYAFKQFDRDAITLLSAITVVFTGLLFTIYYTPDILEAQRIGEAATQSDAFNALHKGSEIDFKLLAFGLLVLMGRRIYRMAR